jgi:hypothetical protein
MPTSYSSNNPNSDNGDENDGKFLFSVSIKNMNFAKTKKPLNFQRLFCLWDLI